MDTISTPMLPLGDIAKVLITKDISRTLYLRVRHRWLLWLENTGQPHYPISITQGEKDAMDFIDYQLSAEEKDACLAWSKVEGFSHTTLVDEVVHDGYRITFTHDEKNSCIVVTLIGRATDCPNHNKAMTTRHADILSALLMCLYKQIVIFENKSWGETATENLFG